MTKTLKVLAMIALVAGVWGGLAYAQTHGKGQGKGTGMHGMCPLMVEGAEVKVVDRADGVTIEITSKDPETVKKIQEAAANRDKHCRCAMMGKEKNTGKDKASARPAAVKKMAYACPMHPDVISDKPGKCPKCGMELKKEEAAKDPAKETPAAEQKK